MLMKNQAMTNIRDMCCKRVNFSIKNHEKDKKGVESYIYDYTTITFVLDLLTWYS